MLEKVKYINHLNEEIEFGIDGLYANENALHNFTWNAVSKNNKISSFDKKIQKKPLPVVIKCNSNEEGLAMRDRLFEVCEKDVIAMKHGKLIVGDYYMKCYVVSCDYKDYMKNSKCAKINLSIQTDYAYWSKESKFVFGINKTMQGSNLDFNNDFPYDYTMNVLADKLNNTDFVASNFRLVIHGDCIDPTVYIAGHEYTVHTSLEASEYLTIDSVSKTIVKTDANGVETNCFNLRNKDSYIFEKIPAGESNVSSSTDFVFEVILIEERGVPRWT